MIDPDRSDRLDRFYKSIFRIVGAILLVGGLWMFGYYRSAASAPTGTDGGRRTASYEETIRQARADERRLGSILGMTGAGMGVATLATAELLPRIRRRGARLASS
ncbi:MAG: hypothetical protein IPK07_31685 [Deltaproteobacteria bacterium]|nr:hypothetical protein [Deltaproteobacteria bacterium]